MAFFDRFARVLRREQDVLARFVDRTRLSLADALLSAGEAITPDVTPAQRRSNRALRRERRGQVVAERQRSRQRRREPSPPPSGPRPPPPPGVGGTPPPLEPGQEWTLVRGYGDNVNAAFERAQFASRRTADAAYDDLLDAGVAEWLLAIAYWPRRGFVLYVGQSGL